MLSAFDMLLLAAAVMIMPVGFWRRRSRLRMGQAEDLPGRPSALVGYLLGHGRILKNPRTGIPHLLLFWGVVIPLIVVFITQFGWTAPAMPALVLSLLTDLAGIAMLAATVFLLVRRLKSGEPQNPRRILLPLIFFLFIVLTGFLAEGTRLSIVPPPFSWASPVGRLFSLCLPDSPRLMQLMIRFHFFGVVLLIAILPFTFLRHIVSASLNVCYQGQENRGAIKKVSFDHGPLGAAVFSDFSWKQLLDADSCVACGRCDENCPASIAGRPLSPRKVMRTILDQMDRAKGRGPVLADPSCPRLEDGIGPDEIWACTTCMACVEHCPVCINPLDKIIDMRRHRVMGEGILPVEVRPMMKNLEIYGDVQGRGIAYRTEWAFNQAVPLIGSGAVKPDILLWIGCSGAFHPRYQEVARAMVKILRAGGVQFAVLGKEELCCGDPARRMGEETLYLELVRKNIARFQRYDFQKIVALCPHCFNTLKNEYPAFSGGPRSGSGRRIEVMHAVELIDALIVQKRLALNYPLKKSVTLHDPCYLGRANRIYEPLRGVVAAVPGIELKELPRNRAAGFCCGGGGGWMWLHERTGRRINQIRSEEIAESGAGLVGTACPYCLTMIEDGIQSLEMKRPPKVWDVIEIVAGSLGPG